MRAGELRDGQAVEAAAQILDGLAHAHSRGIVHRDVKPSNVLLAEDDGISVRLLDFGLAQFDEAETLTAVGDVPGTLAYISPERLRGEEAAPASDVWAVGVLLWEALAGKHPFWGVPLPQMAGDDRGRRPPLAARAARPAEAAARARSRTRSRPTRPGGRPRPRSRRSCRSRARAATSARRKRRARLASRDLAPSALLRPRSPASRRSPAATALPVLPRPAGRPRSRPRRAFAAFRAPRAGLALALAAPVLPLGNLALGLALLYGVLALGWLALSWRDAALGLAFLAGPVLAAVGLLALVPLVAAAGREATSAGRAQTLAAVAVAAVVAGLRGVDASVRQGVAPPLDLAGVESAVDGRARPGRRRPGRARARARSRSPRSPSRCPTPATPWRLAGLGAGMLAATLLLAPAAPALPLVAAAWLTRCLADLALDDRALDSSFRGHDSPTA